MGLRRPCIFQSRERRRTGKIGGFIQRAPLQTTFEQRIRAQGIGVMAILVGIADLLSPLSKQGLEAMGDVGRVTRVPEGVGQPLGETDLTVDTPENHGAKVR